MRRESRKEGGLSADTMAEAQSHDKVRGLWLAMWHCACRASV